jgi:hypothetical protein
MCTLAVAARTRNLKPSKWKNEFKVSQHGRDNAIRLFEENLMINSELLEAISELSGKVLVCHCRKGERCRADILIMVFKMRLTPRKRGMLRPPPQETRRLAVDGGGIPSTGDWSAPPPGERDWLKDCGAPSYFQRIFTAEWLLPLRNRNLIYHSTEDLSALGTTLRNLLQTKGCIAAFGAAPGQPYNLNVVEDIRAVTHDRDHSLVPNLLSGIPAGYFKPIPASVIFLAITRMLEAEKEPLRICADNWESAEDDPDPTKGLVKADVGEGFVKHFAGALEDARAQGAVGVAVGKLGVSRPRGEDPRLTLDSRLHCSRS